MHIIRVIQFTSKTAESGLSNDKALLAKAINYWLDSFMKKSRYWDLLLVYIFEHFSFS